MTVEECRNLVWAVVRNLSRVTGGPVLDGAIHELARLAAKTGGAGFPAPVEPSEDERNDVDKRGLISACQTAAQAALMEPPTAVDHVFMAPSADGLVLGAQATGARWPIAAAERAWVANRPVRQLGPYGWTYDKRRTWYLFLYTAQDMDVAELVAESAEGPGLCPRPLPAAPSPRPATSAGPTDWRGIGRRAWLAAPLALLALALVLASFAVVRGAASVASGAYQRFVERADACVCATPETGPAAGTLWTPVWRLKDGTDPRTPGVDAFQQGFCSYAWMQALDAEARAVCQGAGAYAGWRAASRGLAAFTLPSADQFAAPTKTDGSTRVVAASLYRPFLITMAALVIFIVAIGFAISGQLKAVFIDERNRVSLSRIQAFAWTVVLLSGFLVLSLWNIGLHEDQQVLSRTDVPAAAMFPKFQWELWALLFLVGGTPFVSSFILQSKRDRDLPGPAAPPTPGVRPGQETTIGQLDARLTPFAAGMVDLFRGEDASNRNVIDISRVQHFVITLLLLVAYAQYLVQAVHRITGDAVVAVLSDPGRAFFAAMPPIDETFFGLLAFSHAGYLGFKAMASFGAPAASPAGRPRPSILDDASHTA